MTKEQDTCCEKFDPKPWDGKEISWKNKRFAKDHVASFLHMPLNFGAVTERLMKKIEAANALEKSTLMLTDEKSLWGADLLIATTKDVPNTESETLTGTYLTKVFEGEFKNAGTWAKDMAKYVEEKGKVAKKLYFWYTTCPKCAKKYGKNYVVLFAQI